MQFLKPLHTQDFSYSLRRYYIDEFFFRHISQLPSNTKVLDLGGTRIAKRGEFDIERYDLDVTYLNLSRAKHPDIQGNALQLPCQRECVDAVICAELLEHVEKPQAVLQEAYQVLRPGGKLFISVPFLFRIHPDPYDFGRYTDHFWRSSLEDMGFQSITIENQGLFFSVLVDFGRQYLSEIGVRRPFSKGVYWLMRRFQTWALKRETLPEIRKNAFLSSFTIGFGIVAQK